MTLSEAIIYLRVILDDEPKTDIETGEVLPPEYTDDGLGLLLAIGIKQTQLALDIPKGLRISVSMTEPYVDPYIDICDEFIEVVILNTLCRLQKRNIEQQFGLDSISTTIGPVSLRLARAQWANMPKFIWESTSPCVEYDRKLTSLAAFDTRRTRAIYAILANVAGRCHSYPGYQRAQLVSNRPVDEHMIQ